MKTNLLILAFLFLLLNNSFSQNPLVKQWDYRFGGSAADQLTSFIQTRDGGFVLAGYSSSPISGDKSNSLWGSYDYWIVKTDSTGIKQWDKDFGGVGDDWNPTIIQTSDGGYILGGSTYSGIGGDKTQPNIGIVDYWIIKIDSMGTKQWDSNFGGSDYDYLWTIQQTSDGGYILGGQSISGISGDKTQNTWGQADFWIVKTDALGVKQWDKDFGSTTYESLNSLLQTSDGGYLLAGTSASGIGGTKTQNTYGGADYWIVKIDSLGTKQWDADYGGTNDDVLQKIVRTSDGGFMLGGYSSSAVGGDKTQNSWGLNDFWIVKIDSLGIKLWDKDFGATNDEDAVGNLIQTYDHGYLICGSSYSGISGDKTEDNLGLEQSWVVKTDSLGMKQWDKTIFTNGHDESSIAVQTLDGCFAITNNTGAGIGGYKSQPTRGTQDYWIIKFCDTTNILLPVSFFTVGVNNFCSGNCTSFNDLSLLADSQLWLFPGGAPSSSHDLNPQTICYNLGGNYDVTLITYNMYGSDTLLIPGYITVYPQPNVPNIIQSSDTLIAQAGYYSYQWYYFTNTIPGATNYYYIATQNGDYSVVVTDSNGCDAGRGIVNVLTGINNLDSDLADAIGIFPNPSNGIFMICFNPAFFATQTTSIERNNFQIEIRDVLGKIIYSDGLNISSISNRNQIRLDAPEGIYFVKVLDGETVMTAKIIIQN